MSLTLAALLALLAWFIWRPVHRALSAVQSMAAQTANGSDGSWAEPLWLPTELERISQALALVSQKQGADTFGVVDSMQALERGQLPHGRSVDALGSTDSPALLAVRAGLGHLSAMLSELNRFILQTYSEVHDTSNARTSMPSDWLNDPLLGPALQKITDGHMNLLRIVHAMSSVVEKSAITLADLSWQANGINQEMKALAVKGAQISHSSQSLAQNSSRVSADAASVAQLAQRSRDNSEQGQHELQQTIESMRQMGGRTQIVSSSITGLQSSSKKIEHIVQLIRDIANKINLLSLNAAIEAARAGEHGKGFAVVSDEVRKLAEKTFEATQEIDASVGGIMSQTEQAVVSMNELLGDVQANVVQIEQVGQRLSGILDSSCVLSEQMDGIVQASSASADEVGKISNYLGEIQDELASFGLRIASQEKQTLGLTELSEGFFEKLVSLNLLTLHQRMYTVARAAADAVQFAFEQAISKGQISAQDLLSQEHQPVPHTNPQKYTSRFDAFTDKTLPSIQEAVLRQSPELVFAICTNQRGYVPTHNDKFAHPLTGRYDVDLINSRSKRIFSDRTGSRCGSHTQKVLLQTYKRDTGEIMHDLSVPIWVNGKHWGGFRMGYKAH
ncbi:methyl-accepting chemotaxis protein [Limnohabitans sp. DCL3]|uniref:methyl-accepting chemotaxis protein n=1 Tax=Limnohabitans sp. DCL3 TaxID=3374103 RepID=UPI003A89CDF0